MTMVAGVVPDKETQRRKATKQGTSKKSAGTGALSTLGR